jgi:NAD(P)-dependent dehydrogenase (short-subunit alcohol dehydrogenase family)
MASDPGSKLLRWKMIKRIGQPEDIAWTATFLCSDEAGYITGADFADAGSTAW